MHKVLLVQLLDFQYEVRVYMQLRQQEICDEVERLKVENCKLTSKVKELERLLQG